MFLARCTTVNKSACACFTLQKAHYARLKEGKPQDLSHPVYPLNFRGKRGVCTREDVEDYPLYHPYHWYSVQASLAQAEIKRGEPWNSVLCYPSPRSNSSPRRCNLSRIFRYTLPPIRACRNLVVLANMEDTVTDVCCTCHTWSCRNARRATTLHVDAQIRHGGAVSRGISLG